MATKYSRRNNLVQGSKRINFHGLVGIFLIIVMFIIAYFHTWKIDWLYFVATIIPYSIAVIYLTTIQIDSRTGRSDPNISRLLFSCHFALAFLALGLWLNFGNILIDGAFFISGGIVGFSIPFVLVSTEKGAKFIPYGLVGILAIISMFGVAFYWHWNITWWYFTLALVLYSIVVISVTLIGEDAEASTNIFFIKSILGFHIALLILAVGLWFRFESFGINVAFFLAGTAGGLAIPHLLLRG
jgi:hypothetical protein